MKAWLLNTSPRSYPVRAVLVHDEHGAGHVQVFWDLRRRTSRRWRCTACGTQRTATCPHARAARPVLAEHLGFREDQP